MAGAAQTLTALGSFWKGRKPLILAKACILGCLLPATDNPKRDLEIFEKLMAMLFMLSERIHQKDTHPLLSCADIEELLAHFLPRRDVSEEEVILQLEQRHRQRQKAIESHSRCQKKNNKARGDDHKN